MKNFILSIMVLIIALTLANNAKAQSSIPDSSMWGTDGIVYSMATQGNICYIGGGFSHVGPNIPYGVTLHETTGQPDLAIVKPNGSVYASIPDGMGGWIIGGLFTKVGGVSRSNLARINADGTLNPWNPISDGKISKLLLVGNNVYVTGDFRVINGQNRRYLASIDLTSGLLTNWDPAPNNTVNDFAVHGNELIVGGSFGVIGGQQTGRLAAIDLLTGLATNWSPGPGGDVNSLAIDGNTVRTFAF